MHCSPERLPVAGAARFGLMAVFLYRGRRSHAQPVPETTMRATHPPSPKTVRSSQGRQRPPPHTEPERAGDFSRERVHHLDAMPKSWTRLSHDGGACDQVHNDALGEVDERDRSPFIRPMRGHSVGRHFGCDDRRRALRYIRRTRKLKGRLPMSVRHPRGALLRRCRRSWQRVSIYTSCTIGRGGSILGPVSPRGACGGSCRDTRWD